MASENECRPPDIEFYHDSEKEVGGDGKWKGGLKARMDFKASIVWEILGDFGGIQRWGLLAESKIVHGQPNVEGCVRYCKTLSKNPDGEHRWAHEKLLTYNGEEFCHTYAIIDGNIGWEGYVATLRVVGLGARSSQVEWLFELEPLRDKDEKQSMEHIGCAYASKVKHLHEILSKANGSGSVDG